MSQTGNTSVTTDITTSTDMTSTGRTTTAQTTSTQTLGDLVASPDNVSCAYVPHGSLTGADQLTAFFHILLIGADPSQLSRLVAVRARSDTGLAANVRSAVSNRGATPLQFDLRASDFGRVHTISIVVDSSNEVNETDEGNNGIRVDVRLPSPRPSVTIGDLPCSAVRAA
jgi:hypothetical protein